MPTDAISVRGCLQGSANLVAGRLAVMMAKGNRLQKLSFPLTSVSRRGDLGGNSLKWPGYAGRGRKGKIGRPALKLPIRCAYGKEAEIEKEKTGRECQDRVPLRRNRFPNPGGGLALVKLSIFWTDFTLLFCRKFSRMSQQGKERNKQKTDKSRNDEVLLRISESNRLDWQE